MTEPKPAPRRNVAATPQRDETRSLRRARTRAERATVTDEGRPTRSQRRAMSVARRADERRAEDRAIGSAERVRTRSLRAGAMPHVPSGKHQEKLAERRASRREARVDRA